MPEEPMAKPQRMLDPALLASEAPDFGQLPRKLTRRPSAQFVSHYYFPITEKGLSEADIPYLSAGRGRPVLYQTRQLAAWAEARLAERVTLNGCRRKKV
jgi:hypothetical protein